MKISSAIARVSGSALSLLAYAQVAYAQNPGIVVEGLFGCNFRTGKLLPQCIPIFIGHIIQTVVSVLSVLFLLNVLYAGYQIAMGSWTGEKAAGKDRLTWSIIGLVVSTCAFLIIDLVVDTLAPM